MAFDYLRNPLVTPETPNFKYFPDLYCYLSIIHGVHLQSSYWISARPGAISAPNRLPQLSSPVWFLQFPRHQFPPSLSSPAWDPSTKISGLAISSVKSSWNLGSVFPFSACHLSYLSFFIRDLGTIHAVGFCTVSWMRECRWFCVGLISLVAILRQVRMKDQMFETEGSGKTIWFWGHRVIDQIRFGTLLRRPHRTVLNWF